MTPEYCAKHNWLVGSPDTVVAQAQRRSTRRSAASGTLLLFCFDYSENPKAWQHSMELLAKEVMPRFKNVVPK